MSQQFKVLLVDDHAMVKDALAERLRSEEMFEVVGTAENAEVAIEKALVSKPDIIVMDIDMPGLIAFDAAKTIQSLLPKIRIMFLSAFTHDRYIEQALRVRARAYVTKGEPLSHVMDALKQVAEGGTYFSKQVRERLVVGGSSVSLKSEHTTKTSKLSDRELQVLRYVATGMSKKEIANTMHLSVKTIENHCTNMMTKLDIHDRVELARYAIREGVAEA